MRTKFSVGLLAAAALFTVLQTDAKADWLLGPKYGYEGRWCANMDTGADRIERDCTIDSFAQCRQMIIAGNRGFCSQNPAYAYDNRPVRKKKRRIAR